MPALPAAPIFMKQQHKSNGGWQKKRWNVGEQRAARRFK
ncbi:MAG: hypothetical protein ACI9HK_004443 [Pirellulaceae bacterium]|jgi:hypothetical protein